MVINENYLTHIFGAFGGLEDCVVKQHMLSQRREKQGGYAFLYFKTMEFAEHVMSIVHASNGLLDDVTYDCKLSCVNPSPNSGSDRESNSSPQHNVSSAHQAGEQKEVYDNQATLPRKDSVHVTHVNSFDVEDCQSYDETNTIQSNNKTLTPDIRGSLSRFSSRGSHGSSGSLPASQHHQHPRTNSPHIQLTAMPSMMMMPQFPHQAQDQHVYVANAVPPPAMNHIMHPAFRPAPIAILPPQQVQQQQPMYYPAAPAPAAFGSNASSPHNGVSPNNGSASVQSVSPTLQPMHPHAQFQQHPQAQQMYFNGNYVFVPPPPHMMAPPPMQQPPAMMNYYPSHHQQWSSGQSSPHSAPVSSPHSMSTDMQAVHHPQHLPAQHQQPYYAHQPQHFQQQQQQQPPMHYYANQQQHVYTLKQQPQQH